MNRFKYKEEMGFFKIQDREDIIPTFFVDTKDEADKFINLLNTINPKITGNTVTIKWKDSISDDIYFNNNKMDIVEIKILENYYRTGKEVFIEEKTFLNLKSFVDKGTSEDIVNQLNKCSSLQSILANNSFSLNQDFILIQRLTLKDEERKEILNEIHEIFPSTRPRFIPKIMEGEYDLLVKF